MDTARSDSRKWDLRMPYRRVSSHLDKQRGPPSRDTVRQCQQRPDLYRKDVDCIDPAFNEVLENIKFTIFFLKNSVH